MEIIERKNLWGKIYKASLAPKEIEDSDDHQQEEARRTEQLPKVQNVDVISMDELCTLFSCCHIQQTPPKANIREEPPAKPKRVKLRRSKRIAALNRKKAREAPPTRRSPRIAAMQKKVSP